MINTVPRGVQLTEEIKLIPAKVSWARIHWEKQLLFNVAFRVRPIKLLYTAPIHRVFYLARYPT